MIIKQLKLKNYRTLENVDIMFNGYYTAICGRNNVGKSNIIRSIRNILDSDIRFNFFGNILSIGAFNWNDEITSWKKDLKEDITIDITLEIDKKMDSAIHKFLTDLIFKGIENDISDKKNLQIKLIKTSKNETKHSIFWGNDEVKDDYQMREILKRLQNTKCIIFHNSTRGEDFNPFGNNIDRISNFINPEEFEPINKKKDDLTKFVQKSLKTHQKELTDLLGNLEDKYEVSLSIQGLNIERETIDISIKEKGGEISLEEWGSGTKNRTLIFLNLLSAKRMQDSSDESDRITPIVLIEEPESYLHPQAQAEFGRILQDLANRLQIQVIVTTHSPYLLSFKESSSNILIERKINSRNKDTSSHIIATDGEKWYEPFALVLGVKGEGFKPFRNLIFNESSKILLVEGKIDKEYFELLQGNHHGDKALTKDVEIHSVDGADNFKHNGYLNFIKSRFKNVIVCVDLDYYEKVKKSLENIGFKENINMFPIGTKTIPCVEGLIPENMYNKIARENDDILNFTRIASSSNANTDEIKSAKNSLKKLLLEAFKKEEINEENYINFYNLTKKLNKTLK